MKKILNSYSVAFLICTSNAMFNGNDNGIDNDIVTNLAQITEKTSQNSWSIRSIYNYLLSLINKPLANVVKPKKTLLESSVNAKNEETVLFSKFTEDELYNSSLTTLLKKHDYIISKIQDSFYYSGYSYSDYDYLSYYLIEQGNICKLNQCDKEAERYYKKAEVIKAILDIKRAYDTHTSFKSAYATTFVSNYLDVVSEEEIVKISIGELAASYFKALGSEGMYNNLKLYQDLMEKINQVTGTQNHSKAEIYYKQAEALKLLMVTINMPVSWNNALLIYPELEDDDVDRMSATLSIVNYIDTMKALKMNATDMNNLYKKFKKLAENYEHHNNSKLASNFRKRAKIIEQIVDMKIYGLLKD